MKHKSWLALFVGLLVAWKTLSSYSNETTGDESDSRQLKILFSTDVSGEIPLGTNISLYVLDVGVNASKILGTKFPLSPSDWRHYNPAIHFYNENIFYVGRVSRLARECTGGKNYWIKVNKFIGSLLQYNETSNAFDLKNEMFIDPFETTKKKIINPRSKDIDLRSMGDCELVPDYADGGHGYHDPRLFSWNKKLHILFNARDQVYDGSYCKDGTSRSQYLAEMNFANEKFSITSPIKLHVDGRRGIEKNWTPIPATGSKMLFSYQLFPEHVVLECDLLGFCAEKFRTSSRNAFRELLNRQGQYFQTDPFTPHGGSVLLPFSSGKAIAPQKYMGVLHFSRKESKKWKTYFNCFYLVDAQEPYKILSVVADHIPLTYDPGREFRNLMAHAPKYYVSNYQPDNQVAFVSDASLVPSGDLPELCGGKHHGACLILSYGVADAVARVRIMNLD